MQPSAQVQMNGQSTVRIDWCVVSGSPLAPAQLYLVPIGIIMLSLVTLQLGFFAILLRLISQTRAFPLAARASVSLRWYAFRQFAPRNSDRLNNNLS
jgi:hypothetical protein